MTKRYLACVNEDMLGHTDYSYNDNLPTHTILEMPDDFGYELDYVFERVPLLPGQPEDEDLRRRAEEENEEFRATVAGQMDQIAKAFAVKIQPQVSKEFFERASKLNFDGISWYLCDEWGIPLSPACQEAWFIDYDFLLGYWLMHASTPEEGEAMANRFLDRLPDTVAQLLGIDKQSLPIAAQRWEDRLCLGLRS